MGVNWNRILGGRQQYIWLLVVTRTYHFGQDSLWEGVYGRDCAAEAQRCVTQHAHLFVSFPDLSTAEITSSAHAWYVLLRVLWVYR